MYTLSLLQAVATPLPGWVGPTVAISLAIIALACVVMFAGIALAALAARRALQSILESLGEMQALVGRVREEGDAYLATSRRLRRRLDHGIDRVSERAADLDALYEVVHEEVEETALRFASALRTARLSTGIIARVLRRGRRR
jgi:uncharacterized protein YoxC